MYLMILSINSEATNIIRGVEQVRDTNPEYDSVDASQGTKASDSHSPKNQVKGNCYKMSECHIRKSKHLKGQWSPPVRHETRSHLKKEAQSETLGNLQMFPSPLLPP